MSLSEIADFLKAPPFNRKVNQVTLDEQSPQEWLQLLSDVLTTLKDTDRVDLRDETPDQTAFRISDFMTRILNYKPTVGVFVIFFVSVFDIFTISLN